PDRAAGRGARGRSPRAVPMGGGAAGRAHLLQTPRHLRGRQLRARRLRPARHRRQRLGVDGELVRALPVAREDRARPRLPRRQLEPALREVAEPDPAQPLGAAPGGLTPRLSLRADPEVSALPVWPRRGRSSVSARGARGAVHATAQLERRALRQARGAALPRRLARGDRARLRARHPHRRGSGTRRSLRRPARAQPRVRRRLPRACSRSPARVSLAGRHPQGPKPGRRERRLQEPRRWCRMELRLLSLKRAHRCARPSGWAAAAALTLSTACAAAPADGGAAAPRGVRGLVPATSRASAHAATSDHRRPRRQAAEAHPMSAPRARDARVAAGANAAQADNEPEDPAVVSPRPSERPPPALPSETTVLHIGDSFAGALGLPLGRRLKGAGSKSVLHFKTASFIPNWAHSKELRLWLLRYQPDLVLITLGANEIEIVEPEQRAKPVRRLVQALEGRPCVWVGPPLWTDDTRLMDVIRDNVSPCR